MSYTKHVSILQGKLLTFENKTKNKKKCVQGLFQVLVAKVFRNSEERKRSL